MDGHWTIMPKYMYLRLLWMEKIVYKYFFHNCKNKYTFLTDNLLRIHHERPIHDTSVKSFRRRHLKDTDTKITIL